MSSGEASAPNIYVKQLLPMRHGYPLWHPEIEEEKGLEVQIGDVGYMHDGNFTRIFNATLPGDHDDHQRYGVPPDHTPFEVNDFLMHNYKKVIESHLCSRSVSSFSLEGSAMTPVMPIGAGINFQCSEDQGAFVFMNVAAARKQMHASITLPSFIRNNIERWHEYVAQKFDLKIALEQIMFISGVTKTNDWGLGAFARHGKGGAVSFSAQVPFFQGSFSVQKQEGRVSNIHHRTKPNDATFVMPSPAIEGGSPEAGPSSRGYESVPTDTLKRDQTLFVNYYKMKKRLWIKTLKAEAGPDQRDPDRTGDGEDVAAGVQVGDESFIVHEPSIEPAYDPVDDLLDYILNYPMEDGTEVAFAIASDLHIYALFDGEIPLDIRDALEKMRPPVMFVDDNREVACLAVAEWAEEIPEADVAANKAAGKQKDDSLVPDESEDRRQGRFEGDADDSKAEGEDKDSRPTAGGDTQGNMVLQEHTGGVTCVAFSPDGMYIASGSEDTTVILRDGTSGALIEKLTEHNEPVWALAFSPDSTRLCTGASIALVWDVKTLTVVAVLDGHTGVVQTIAYSPNGQKIVTSSVDFSVRIWDSTTGNMLHKLEEHSAVVMSALFSPNGKWVASCSADYTAKVWNAETGALLHSLEAHSGVVWSVAFSGDSRRLVTGSDDMTSRVWNVETGEELVILHEHQGPVWSVAFSPDDKFVMSASNDATIKICDSYSGDRKHAFDRHDTLVNTAVYSPDGKWIASSAGDNAVVVWDTDSGKNLPPMEGHLDKVTGLQFSPESDRLVSCSDDGTVRIWSVPENVDAPEAAAVAAEEVMAQ